MCLLILPVQHWPVPIFALQLFNGMKVFKFGGASVSSVDRIKNIPSILDKYRDDRLVIIISAMGKTTNALEKVTENFYNGNLEQALHLFNAIKQQHLTTAKYLLAKNAIACEEQLNQFFTEVEWMLHDKPVKSFDYYYDQVVCIGELLSTVIITHYLSEAGFNNRWIDVRDVIRTDDNFREANIDWTVTGENVNRVVLPIFEESTIIITQGFIGSTDENESTTLGREGSDFTAAIFTNLLNAECLSIWKDVEGVMNADPRQFPKAELINELNFEEVIEMAYYGAQVIHPKTIKPLQNKNIPLHVKCFLDSSIPGTIIHNKNIKNLPPIIVIKEKQVLVHLNSQDFSFVGERPMSYLYELFAELNIRPTLIQTGAISVQVCLDDRPDKIEQFAAKASSIFDVQVETGLELLTLRHYTPAIIQEMVVSKTIVLQQQTPSTLQVLYRTNL